MLKAIFYFILIYMAFRLYRAISKANVVYKSYHYHDNRKTEKEGEVIIKTPSGKKSQKQRSLDTDGDYIDYEEIKD